MAWKKNEDGTLAADSSGNPVWIFDSGEEKGIDYAASLKRQSETNAESKARKEELRALKEKYAVLEGIEDLAAWHKEAQEALEFRKNASDKDKELEAQVNGRVEAATRTLKEQLADREKKLGEKEKSISELTGKLNRAAVLADVHASKVLANRLTPEDRIFMERELVRAGAVDEEGKVYYHDDQGKTLFGAEGNATADEAIPLLMEKLGIDPKKKLLSQDNSSGSGATPGQGGQPGQKNPWKKEYWNVTEQCRITRENPVMAASMKAAAGV